MIIVWKANLTFVVIDSAPVHCISSTQYMMFLLLVSSWLAADVCSCFI